MRPTPFSQSARHSAPKSARVDDVQDLAFCERVLVCRQAVPAKHTAIHRQRSPRMRVHRPVPEFRPIELLNHEFRVRMVAGLIIGIEAFEGDIGFADAGFILQLAIAVPQEAEHFECTADLVANRTAYFIAKAESRLIKTGVAFFQNFTFKAVLVRILRVEFLENSVLVFQNNSLEHAEFRH
jgi:hypothetical protein